MLLFRFYAKKIDGTEINNTKEASSERELLRWMKENGYRPLDIEEVVPKVSIAENPVMGHLKERFMHGFYSMQTVPTNVTVVMFRELATMIDAGIPISSTLDILKKQTDSPKMQIILGDLQTKVSRGKSLSQSMSNHPKVFSHLMVSLVKSGEESGTLDVALQKIADFIESRNLLKKKIMSALAYPAVVLVVALVVLALMVGIAIPQFETAFSNLQIQMPLITQRVFSFGRFCRNNYIFILGVFILIFMCLKFLRRDSKVRYFTDGLVLKLPIYGDMVYKSSMSAIARTMSILLRSGVPVLDSIEMSASVIANTYIQQSFFSIKEMVSRGHSISDAMEEQGMFRPMVYQMVAIGEETGKTDEMFSKVSEWYESDVKETVKKFMSVLEPVMVVVVGMVVAIIVFALFLPIITSIQSFL